MFLTRSRGALEPGSAIVNTAVRQATTRAVADGLRGDEGGHRHFTKVSPAGPSAASASTRSARPGVDAADPGDDAARQAESFGEQRRWGGPAQPAEIAPALVYLASQEPSYVSAEVIGATGGTPLH